MISNDRDTGLRMPILHKLDFGDNEIEIIIGIDDEKEQFLISNPVDQLRGVRGRDKNPKILRLQNSGNPLSHQRTFPNKYNSNRFVLTHLPLLRHTDTSFFRTLGMSGLAFVLRRTTMDDYAKLLFEMIASSLHKAIIPQIYVIDTDF